MIHVETFQTRLRELLTFEQFELFSQKYKIWLSNQAVLKIVAFEDVIDVVGLRLEWRNW